MYRIVVIAALAAFVAGCGGVQTRPDAAAAAARTAADPDASAEAVAEVSPKKPKLSCVQ